MVTTLPPTSPVQTAALRAADRLIVALDFPDATAALACVDQLAGSVSWFKVGLELYLASGDGVVNELKKRGHSVFLDLKLHDIPNTAASAVRSLARLEPDLLTVHAAGGRAMLRPPPKRPAPCPSPPRLLAVTVLTSRGYCGAGRNGRPRSSSGTGVRLARLAAECGIEGMVCSPAEAAALHSALPQAFW